MVNDRFVSPPLERTDFLSWVSVSEGMEAREVVFWLWFMMRFRYQWYFCVRTFKNKNRKLQKEATHAVLLLLDGTCT